jgi:hypothetical protein
LPVSRADNPIIQTRSPIPVLQGWSACCAASQARDSLFSRSA